MSSYVQNYGFTKTFIQDNNRNINNEIQWTGNYDGNIANINLDINNNGNKEFVSMQLTNKDLNELLGVQPINTPLEKRLINDFSMNKLYKPITLEGALIKRKTRRHRKKHHKHKKSRKSRKSYYSS